MQNETHPCLGIIHHPYDTMPTEEEPLVEDIRQRHLADTSSGACIAANDEYSGERNVLLTNSFLRRAQSVSIGVSLLLSPVAILLVSVWASLLGGVSWAEGDAKHVFNWHPVMMVTAYAIMNASALAFRVSGTSSYQAPLHTSPNHTKRRTIAKFSHAFMWTISVVVGIVGIFAVFKSHNDPISGYIANLYSLHSWIGMTVLSIYTIQFLVGMLSFGGLHSGSRSTSKPILMEMHKFTGTYIHILATMTILLGIQEKEGFVSCSYTVDLADVPPSFNFGKIPHPCKISHALGMVIVIMGFCTNMGLAKFASV